MVVKLALPFSSRFTPVAPPIGFSGFFSSVGASVFSAHCFSDSEGCRPSKISWIGDSATLDGFFFSLPLAIAASLPAQISHQDGGCRKLFIIEGAHPHGKEY